MKKKLFVLTGIMLLFIASAFAQISADLYVSTTGDDSNSGTSAAQPLKTIYYALSIIEADSLNPHTIYLAPGTYGPSTNGETFPIFLMDYVSIQGNDQDDTILDAESQNNVVQYQNIHSGELRNVTLTNGNSGGNGGGIYCDTSNLDLTNVKIIENGTRYSGGGICCFGSNINLSGVTIANNTAYQDHGGGILSWDSSLNFDSVNRCNIFLNDAPDGKDLYTNGNIHVVVDTFTVLEPTEFYAWPIENYTFDILHAKKIMVDADLYVSTTGDDSNSGTSAGDPFKTIYHALSVILADSLDPHTVYLAPGTYSQSTNEEIFPVTPSSYVTLQGTAADEVILDAEYQDVVVSLSLVNNASLQDLTITKGNEFSGGGIYCWQSKVSLSNLIICDNTTYFYDGAGIYCEDSELSVSHVTISGNVAQHNGGGIYCDNSNASFNHVVITGNRANTIFGTGGCGAGFYSTNANTQITNCTIEGNEAGTLDVSHGGGIYLCDSSISNVVNTIVANNTNYGIYSDTCIVSISYSDAYNNELGNFYRCGSQVGVNTTTNINGDDCDVYYNIQLDPLFMPVNNDYHLTIHSPCINAGDPSSPHDPDGSIADMGVYYFDQTVDIDDPSSFIPSLVQLSNYPNPFRNTTTISYSIKGMLKSEPVQISIYNMLGQLVDTVEGRYGTATWNTKDHSTGIYFYKLNTDNYTEIKKMMVTK